MNRHIYSRFVSCVLLSFASTVCLAQSISNPSADTSPDMYKPYGGVRETVDYANGNVKLRFPVVVLEGRAGQTLEINVECNSKVWAWRHNYIPPYVNAWYHAFQGSACQISPIPQLGAANGVFTKGLSGGLSEFCTANFTLVLPDSGTHWFGNRTNCYDNAAPTPHQISDPINVTDSYDGAHVRLDITNHSDVVAYLRDGTQLHFALDHTAYSGSWTTARTRMLREVDPDGNLITYGYNEDPTTGVYTLASITDSYGRVVSFSYDPQLKSISSVSYPGPGVALRTVVLSWTTLSTSAVFPGDPNSPIVRNYQALQTVTLPNNLSYRFEYNNYGEISKITYPEGGYTRYDYAQFPALWLNPPLNGVYGSALPDTFQGDTREIVARHVCPNSNGVCGPSEEATTTYTPTITSSWPNNQYLDVRDATPEHNRTRYAFLQGGGSTIPYTPFFAPREVNRYEYQGENTLLQTVNTVYNEMLNGTTTARSLPIQITTTLNDSNQKSRVEFDYDSYVSNTVPQGFPFYYPAATTQPIDNVTAKREYDYAIGAVGPLRRTTTSVWVKVNPVNGQDYTAIPFHIMGLKTNEQILDPSTNPATVVAQTQFEYDNYGGSNPLVASGAVQHDAGHGLSYVKRGNLTATKRWRNTDGAFLATTDQYDDAGNTVKTTDPGGHSTQFSYADSWADAACAPVSGITAAYKTRRAIWS